MKKYTILAALLALSLGSCNKDYLNPSTASQQQVVNSSDGLITLCNGLQARYTTGGLLSVIYNSVAVGGLTTKELTILNVGNIEEYNVSLGAGNVTNSNGVVRNLWTQANLVKANADLVLANAGNAPDAGTRSGIVAYASIFRALSLGTLAQFFEKAPLAAQENAPFVDRVQVLQSAVAQLETAAAQLAATPVSADFNAKIVPGIDLPNTLQALIARYSLEAGDYDKAIAAAGRVDLTKRSVFNFDDNTRNPIFEVAFGNRNVFEPFNANLGLTGALAPNSADRRLPFFIRTNPTATQNLGTGFYTANNAPIPVYVPGEMLLIRAEAYARKGDVPNAIIELNRVLTKTPANDVYGLGASLPPYSGPATAADVLTEILRNRDIELAFQGFRLSDSRRFGRPGPGTTGAERNRNFLPYPRTERENNPATPADPVI
ncbi:RagB/SusD family nutrient uptake outer membrane protein [Hymenobacter properus]|uniref:RagB/SusD family nutrient uptake outer membrane protein n=1 Tax=Hymenobacter properus TaxID=2791026 RepID=A0A931BJ64_9BACT|nr:RagB/SusD family nutrient uptake outer membrane protein [Hymenobacter properus]MBF9142327.1 RagB/SusD family nutrient uptake outer membrane protein [Hymenobacter properus]MBR7721134.1 RagB/SusD family nutrient uptake outer membrane protein [Microvirga sp. SRT04]